MIYIMLWEDEKEKWHYYIDSFNKNDFPLGYVDYYIDVENGIITSDTYNDENIGKKFEDVYNMTYWEN